MLHNIRTIIGFALIGLGLIAFLLPVIPSVPFLLAGIALIGAKHPLIKPLINRLPVRLQNLISPASLPK